jgi:hypothetical protein
MAEGLTGDIDAERRFVAWAGLGGLVLVLIGLYLASMEGWGDEAVYAYVILGIGGFALASASFIVSVSSVILSVQRKQTGWTVFIVAIGGGWVYYLIEWFSGR